MIHKLIASIESPLRRCHHMHERHGRSISLWTSSLDTAQRVSVVSSHDSHESYGAVARAVLETIRTHWTTVWLCPDVWNSPTRRQIISRRLNGISRVAEYGVLNAIDGIVDKPHLAGVGSFDPALYVGALSPMSLHTKQTMLAEIDPLCEPGGKLVPTVECLGRWIAEGCAIAYRNDTTSHRAGAVIILPIAEAVPALTSLASIECTPEIVWAR